MSPLRTECGFLIQLGLRIGLVSLVTSGMLRSEEAPQYNRDIRPLLAEHCFACHGLDSLSREADLRLDVRDAAIESGAIVPGDSDNSELVARVLSDDVDVVMPPPETNKRLTPKQRELIKRWIDEGAQYEKHWSLIAPAKLDLPTQADSAWIKNPIDTFVLERLEQAGIEPADEADPRALFRRLHLDITGLPPQPDDIGAFVSDYGANGDDALSKWIDTLMSTTAWGEHRGRYWLDAARYADTHGMHFDNYREMWPYRDWVIRSFNRNQPFDQFTLEQLAGDLLEDPTTDQLVATGFQRCNMTTNEGGTIEAENLAVYAADRVQTFGWVYLGLTTNCCQCHDHKFDPLTTKDYYSLAAFFRNTTQTGLDGNRKDGRGPVIRVPHGSDQARWEVIDAEIASATEALEQRRSAAEQPFQAWLADTDPNSLRTAIPVNGRLISMPLSEGKGSRLLAVGSDQDIQVQATGELNWTVEGKFGPAIELKRGSTLEVGSVGDFAAKQSFTHSAWIRTSKLNQSAPIVARMDVAGKYRGWDLFFANGQLAMHIIEAWPENAIKVTTQSPVIEKDKWHHVCVTWDGSGKPDGISILVDGKRQPTKIDTDKLQADADTTTTSPLRIGQRSKGTAFNGAVQDFHLFDRVLDADEIERLSQVELLARMIELDPKERSDEQRANLFEYFLRHHDAEFSQLAVKVRALQSERDEIESRSPITHVQVERDDQPAMANVLMRGQYDQLGDEVEAAPPAALHPLASDAPKNRLGLARWVVDPANPLTARVTVNRFWQEIFGQGIVVTTEDFGVMGSPPSHPELLDYLATEFVASGWDVKRFFKQMLMSATYRQSSVTTQEKLIKDRDNSLLSRGPRFRMDAEMVRDSALAASGLLSEKMFGPGVRPYQPTDIWNMVGLPGGDTREYKVGAGQELYRRSLYTFWKRMAPPPSLEAFNAPNREVCAVRRERTNTPLQALVTLNDPQYVEAARKLAERSIAGHDGEQRAIIDSITERVLGRPFSDQEMKIALATHADFLNHYSAHHDDAKALLEHGDSKADPALDAPTLAAWTMTCNQIMNLDESLNK